MQAKFFNFPISSFLPGHSHSTCSRLTSKNTKVYIFKFLSGFNAVKKQKSKEVAMRTHVSPFSKRKPLSKKITSDWRRISHYRDSQIAFMLPPSCALNSCVS